MKYDDRPEPAKRLEKARIARGFSTPEAASKYFGWKKSSYEQHENGIRGLSRTSDRYSTAFRISEAWLLTGEGDAPPLPKVPVMGIVAGSITGQNIIHVDPIDSVQRPPALENVPDAYAVWVKGRSMEPAFREGALCFVHPHKQPVRGDIVIIQQIDNGNIPVAFIKELIGTDDKNISVRQYNPPAMIEYPVKHVSAVHKVLTMNELFGL